jgi:hypothetical protein
MSDTYGNFLRRWSLTAAGTFDCVHDAVDVTLIPAETRAAIEAHNAALHAARADVGAFEAALRLRAGEQPFRDETYLDEDGEERTRWSDAYRAWWDAGQAVEAVSPAIAALARLRAGEPEEGDADLVAAEWNDEPEVVIDPAMIERQKMPELEPYQFDAVLDLAELRAVADAAIEAIENPVEKIVARSRKALSKKYLRLDPLFRDLTSAAELPDEQVDALWEWAATL